MSKDTKADTWMPLYIASYLRKTMHLTRDQHGGYLLLLMACWDRGGRLPNDPAQLAGICRATPAEWKRLAPVLLPFFEIDGDQLVQERVIAEHEKAARLSAARREAGSRGGRPKKQNESEPKPIGFQNGSQNETPLQEPIGSNQKPDLRLAVVVGAQAPDEPADWPEGDANQLMYALAAAASSPRLDPIKSPGLITTLGRLTAWRRDGASWRNDVLPTVIVMAGKRGPPIQTWKFFDAAIAQSIADNRQALTIPEARNVRPSQDPGNNRAARRRVWAEVLAEEGGEGAGDFARAR